MNSIWFYIVGSALVLDAIFLLMPRLGADVLNVLGELDAVQVGMHWPRP